ncbi:MAG: hypothetical protein DIU79_06105 [Actinobacteria bacterium]|nr:MAG: hypothetical protein DIU79_06105 [Actinomycetota bacterium]
MLKDPPPRRGEAGVAQGSAPGGSSRTTQRSRGVQPPRVETTDDGNETVSQPSMPESTGVRRVLFAVTCTTRRCDSETITCFAGRGPASHPTYRRRSRWDPRPRRR